MGNNTATLVMEQDGLYGALSEKGVCFLSEEILTGGIPRATVGWMTRREQEKFYGILLMDNVQYPTVRGDLVPIVGEQAR